MKRILIVEDDALLNKTLAYNLSSDGWDVTPALNARTAENLLAGRSYDLVLLDINLPDGNGYDLCGLIKPEHPDTVVIFLTANDQESDQIRGYEAGAVDYITKPFKLGVLFSRINALLRRSKDFADTELCSNGLRVEMVKGQVYKGDALLDLTAGEYKLLCLLMQNPNMVLSKEQILDRLWDCQGSYIDNNTLSVYIRRLREKVEDDPSHPQKIVTVWRMGYKWNVVG